jgi:hypothetical protein
VLGVDRLPRPLLAVVITAGRGIFRRLELVVRPNIESFTVRLPKFRHWLGVVAMAGGLFFYAAASATMAHSNCGTIR